MINFYLVEKEKLLTYLENSPKCEEYEKKLLDTFKEYLNFIGTIKDDPCEKHDLFIKFQLLIEHTNYFDIYNELINIGSAFYQKESFIYYPKISKEKVEEYIKQDYVIIDEHWRETKKYYQSYDTFINTEFK
jgi:hypothetical protein